MVEQNWLDINFLTFTATLASASIASYLSWSSPTLPQLTSENSPIGVTISDEEGSWVASSFLLGSIPGCILAAWIVERFGRRISILVVAFPLGIPWFVIIFAKSTIVLCICRFVAGVGYSIVITGIVTYTSEIAENDIRGHLGSIFNVLKLTGSLFVLSAGPFISYTALALSCSVLPIALFIFFYFMPESPYYLIKVDKKDEARRNLIRLSSNCDDSKTIENRLEEIESTVRYDMKNASTVKELLLSVEYRRSLGIIIGIKTLQQLSGLMAIQSYVQTIIASADDSNISPEISSIIAGAVQFPAALIACAVADKLGRKPLLIISAMGCATALIGEGIYFYIQNVLEADVSKLSWLPTTGLFVYLLMNPIGVYTLPYVLLGELFATNIKGLAVSISTFYGAILSFLVAKLFQPISDLWGIHVTFWFFASVCILGSFFVYFVLPETKGKSFAQIQEELNPCRKVKVKTEVQRSAQC